MRYAMLEKYRDGLLLTARSLLVVLFVKFGLAKAMAFSTASECELASTEKTAWQARCSWPVSSQTVLMKRTSNQGMAQLLLLRFSRFKRSGPP